MQAPNFSEFELLLVHTKNEVGTSLLLILAWIAASDGSIDKSESDRLTQIAVSSKYGRGIQHLITLGKKRNLEAIILACEILKHHYQGDKASLFLKMAIGMAMEDGVLRAPENYILRFLADMLGISKSSLHELYTEVSGERLQAPGDPSRSTFWQNWRDQDQESSKPSISGSDSSNHADSPSTKTEQIEKISADKMKAIESYATLGLGTRASREEISAAYQRLLDVHQPEKFAPLGQEAVAAAKSTLKRIKSAYDYLVRYA